MTDRLHIEITGNLPDKGKHAILAAAETAAEAMAAELSKAHEVTLTAVVRSVRPGKKPVPVAVVAPARHAAE